MTEINLNFQFTTLEIAMKYCIVLIITFKLFNW